MARVINIVEHPVIWHLRKCIICLFQVVLLCYLVLYFIVLIFIFICNIAITI